MSARSVSTLSITVTADTASAIRSLSALQNSVSGMSNRMSQQSTLIGGAMGGILGGKLGGVGGLIGGLVGGPPGAMIGSAVGTVIDSTLGAIASALGKGASLVAEGVKQLLTVGADYEMALAVFSVAAGSDAGGASIVKGLSNLAAGTIFSSQQLREQGMILKGYGVTANEIIPTLTKLALVAQQSGRGPEAIGKIALAFGQAKAAGRLMGNEVLQFKDAGVSAADFAKTMGVLPDQFRDLMEAGAVGFDVVAMTLNRLGTEAEANADKMGKTFTGRINAVKDLALQAFEQIGLSVIKAFGLSEKLSAIAELFRTLPERAAALYPVFERVGKLVEPIAIGIASGLATAASAAGQIFESLTGVDWKSLGTNADSFGRTIAWGMGKALDLGIQLGIHLADAALGMIAMFESIPAAMKPMSDLAKDWKFITEGLVLLASGPGALSALKLSAAAGKGAGKEGSPFAGAASVLKGFKSSLEGAAKTDFGALGEKNFEAFKKMLPNLADFQVELDKSGINVGPPGLPASVKDLASSINKNFVGGKGGSKYQEFMTNMGNLGMAERSGLIPNRAAADQFIAAQFKELTGSMSRIENTLPRAIEANTVEGQAQIEKVVANMTSVQKDIPTILREIAESAKEQIKAENRTAEQVRKIVMPKVMSN